MNISLLAGITGHHILKNSTTFPTFIQENSPKCPVRALGCGFCKQTRHTAVLNFFNPPEKEKTRNKILGVRDLWRAEVRDGLWNHSTNSTAQGSVLPHNPEPALQGAAEFGNCCLGNGNSGPWMSSGDRDRERLLKPPKLCWAWLRARGEPGPGLQSMGWENTKGQGKIPGSSPTLSWNKA